MAIGGLTVFLIAKQAVSIGIAVVTLVLLVAGYTVGRVSALGRAARYLETIFLSLTVFLLLVPSVNETLTRVPNGNPIAKGPDSPILLGALGTLVVLLVVGLTRRFCICAARGATPAPCRAELQCAPCDVNSALEQRHGIRSCAYRPCPSRQTASFFDQF